MFRVPGYTATLSRQAVRSVDRAAEDEFGIPTIVLMENAAAAIEEVAAVMLDVASVDAERPSDASQPVERTTFIICGPGNNGGDGLALARRLSNRGRRVLVLLAAVRERYSGDALTNLTIARRMALPIEDLDTHHASASLHSVLKTHGRPALIVDALFGTGLDRPLAPPMTDIVKWVNALHDEGVRVLAVDIPSGLDADTGHPLGEAAIRADRTVTLAGRKRGFDDPASRAFTGVVNVGDIGVPTALLRRFDGQ